MAGFRHGRKLAVCAWLICVGWLLRYEAFPSFFTHQLGGYRGVFSDAVLLRDSWMRILFNGQAIGYSHSNVEIDETGADSYYRISNRMHVNFSILGEVHPIGVDVDARLTKQYELSRFEFSMRSDGAGMEVEGVRVGGETFEVSVKTAAGRKQMKVQIPGDTILYSPMTEAALARLRPGQEVSVMTLDPATFSPSKLLVRALRDERVKVGSVEYDATVLATDYMGTTIRTWISKAGEALRQETPFGWVLERCEAAEAMAASRASVRADDMLAAQSVKVRGSLSKPREARRLRLKLTGAPLAGFELDSGRQRVVERGAEAVVLDVLRDSARGDSGAPGRAERAVLLAPSQGIESDHEEVIRAASDIVDGVTGDAARAKALYEWVFRHVDKQNRVLLPSAVAVLRELKGDCNEHTYLYVALARAVGLPARVTVGLAYNDGAFYYHAWPAVYAGRWMELDPTWGQEGVDATHVALLSGDLSAQMKLVTLLGRLKIDVLEEEADDRN